MRGPFVGVISSVCVLLGSLTSPAWAQRNTATFAGIVVDTSGAVLPGADVSLTNEGTGIVERQVSNAACSGDAVLTAATRAISST